MARKSRYARLNPTFDFLLLPSLDVLLVRTVRIQSEIEHSDQHDRDSGKPTEEFSELRMKYHEQ
jgi:hypothetical protein